MEAAGPFKPASHEGAQMNQAAKVETAPENGAGGAAPGGFKIFSRITDWITSERLQLMNITDCNTEIVRKSGDSDSSAHLQSLNTTTSVFVSQWQDALVHDIRTLHAE